MTEIKTLIRQLKDHLSENDGEVVYWGEEILGRHCEAPQGPKQSHEIAAAQPKTLGLAMTYLEQLRTETIGDCHRCPLGDTRIKLVFGVGNAETQVMFIGEGPGFDEDRQGEPFVGKAGQLLDKIMVAIELDRSKVYIANIVKCHPMVDPSTPENRGNDRPPSLEEMAKCLPFLKKQIEIIAPKIIVTLGAVATRAILSRAEGITSLRGRFFNFSLMENTPPIRVLPTYHPAALLRDETLKKLVWEDMKKLRNFLHDS